MQQSNAYLTILENFISIQVKRNQGSATSDRSFFSIAKT